MDAVLAVIVGLVVGSALAAAVAFPLRRRRARNRIERTAQARRILLSTPAERHRAAQIAAGFALIGTGCMLAGARAMAVMFLFGAVLMAVQSLAGLAAQHLAAQRS